MRILAHQSLKHLEFSNVKVALSSLRQFLVTERSLKMIKNAFYTFLRYFNFYSECLGHVGKRFDKKSKVTFKMFDATDWITNNCNTHIAIYIKK